MAIEATMRRFILLLRTLPTMALVVLATSTAASAPLCIPGTLNDYIALPAEGCDVGQTTVSGFAPGSLSAGAEAISPADVSVVPIVAPFDAGLSFAYDVTADASDIFESAVLFRVVARRGVPITGLSLRLNGGAASLDGVALAITDVCFGSFLNNLCDASGESLLTLASESTAVPFDSRTIAPAFDLAVRHNAVVDAGLSGTAAVTSTELRFQTVPEPSTAATLVLGIVAGFVLTLCIRWPQGRQERPR